MVMSLYRVIELVGQLKKELTLFNVGPTESIDERLSAHFETHNVRITTVQTASGRPTDIAVLSNNGELLEVFDVDLLRDFVDNSQSSPGTVGISDAKYEVLLSHLKETTFQSHDTEEMLYASREIEDRARRVGTGSIHAGFQQCSVMSNQQAIYTDLAQRELDVHTYGVPDTTPPNLDNIQIHTSRADEIAEMWFVVFDGDGDDAQKTALIAKEVEENVFYGTWTYDSTIVDHVLDHLEATYLSDDTHTHPET